MQPNYSNKHNISGKKPATLGRPLLIVVALCFSVVLGSFAYKIALAHRTASENGALAEKNGNSGTSLLAIGISASSSVASASDIVTNALEEAQINALSLDSATQNPFAITENDTVSDRISKSLFIGYLQADQSSEGVTEDTVNLVADNVISQISSADFPTAKYAPSDVKTFTPKDREQIKQYGNIIAGIIKQNYQIVANNKVKYSADIVALAEIYERIGKTIIKQSAPQEIVMQHSELANSYLLLSEGMKMVGSQEKDPVRAMLGVRTLQEVSTSQQEVLIKITNYFNNNDIIFTSSDVGALWNSYNNISADNSAENSTSTVSASDDATRLNNATNSQ